MDTILKFIFITVTVISDCNGVSYQEQLEHISRRRQESKGGLLSRRFNLNNEVSTILGAPSMASHLPEAEPILPGHTLIRPSLGMLKSAVKYPHKDLDDGAGVYGNINNLGIRYDGRNERVLYSGFRRMPADYLMVVPLKNKAKETKPQKTLKIYPLVSNTKKTKLKNIYSNTHNHGHLKKYFYRSRKPNYAYIDLDIIINEMTSLRRDKPMAVQTLSGHNYYESPQSEDSETSREYSYGNIPDEYSSDEEQKKHNWFWNSQNSFDHIKINQEAPELAELMPTNVTQDSSDWWFYHQEDFQPFQE